jgi:hypothetical protein
LVIFDCVPLAPVFSDAEFVPVAEPLTLLCDPVPFVGLLVFAFCLSSSLSFVSRGEKTSEFGSRIGLSGPDTTLAVLVMFDTSMPWYLSLEAAFAGVLHDASTSPAAVAVDARDRMIVALRWTFMTAPP